MADSTRDIAPRGSSFGVRSISPTVIHQILDDLMRSVEPATRKQARDRA